MSLDTQGFKTVCYSDPALALQEFEKRSSEYDIVLSDIRMPHFTGFEVARKVKALNPSVKIILMTAFYVTIEEFQTVLPTLKIDGLILKPVTMSKLLEVMTSQV